MQRLDRLQRALDQAGSWSTVAYLTRVCRGERPTTVASDLHRLEEEGKAETAYAKHAVPDNVCGMGRLRNIDLLLARSRK
jgi:hypothetical protein